MPVTATGNAAEGIPRGNIRGREGPACGRHPDWMQHYSTKSHVPLGPQITCQTAGMCLRCGAKNDF